MVVPKSELGSEAKRVERDDDSGASDNADAADDTIDPNDTARDLQRAGRIAGYDLYFSDFDALIAEGHGLAVIGTSVELFRDAPAAARYMSKQLGAYERFEGKTVEEISLRHVGHFDVDDLGDEEAGVVLELEKENAKARFWVVAFRVDRLVATANVFTDGVSGESLSSEIAGALRKRIDEVAAGRL